MLLLATKVDDGGRPLSSQGKAQKCDFLRKRKRLFSLSLFSLFGMQRGNKKRGPCKIKGGVLLSKLQSYC